MTIQQLKQEVESLPNLGTLIKDLINSLPQKLSLQNPKQVPSAIESEHRKMLNMELERFHTITKYIVATVYIHDHLQNLAYSLLELRVAVFRRDYQSMGRIVRRFTSNDLTNIKELQCEIQQFDLAVQDITKIAAQMIKLSKGYFETVHLSQHLRNLQDLVTQYQHILVDIDRLFVTLQKELQGNTES